MDDSVLYGIYSVIFFPLLVFVWFRRVEKAQQKRYNRHKTNVFWTVIKLFV